jgi:excisionase family DNA binding protein
MENEWINNVAAAKLLGLSKSTIYSWCLKYDNSFAFRVGKNYRINRHACLKILQGTMPPLREVAPEIEEMPTNAPQPNLFG